MNKLIPLCILIVLFFACRKERTSWNSDWVLPLIKDSLTLESYVNDSTFSVNGSGQLMLNLRRSIFDFNLAEIVEIPDTTIHQVFTPSFTSLTVGPGFQFINDTRENELLLGDIQLKQVNLKHGTVEVELKNPVGTQVYFTVTLPGVTKNGVVFTQQFSAPAGSSSNPGVVNKSYDLSGYELNLTGINGNSFNRIQTVFSVKTDPGGPSVTVTNQQSTIINARFKDAEFTYARGYFGNQVFQDTSETQVDLLNQLTSGLIDIPATTIRFRILNGIKAPARSKLFFAKNVNQYTSSTVSLTHPQLGVFIPVNPADVTFTSFAPSETVYEFTSANSNIEDFIENLGGILQYAYRIELNPYGNDSGGWNEVFEESRVKLEVEAEMPVAVKMDQVTLMDTFDLSLKQNSNFVRVTEGKIELNAANAFPFTADLQLLFLDKNGNVLGSAPADQPVLGAQYGTDLMNGIPFKRSQVWVDIPAALVGKFNQVNSIVVKAVFDTKDPISGIPVQMAVPADAFLGLQLKAHFKTRNTI